MYEAFFGLSSKPFQLNPDPNFYFGSKQHRRAKAYLEYGVSRNDGFIVITGEIGAGKTTILRGLLDGLARRNVVAGHLVTTQLDAEDTLRMVGASFGFKVQGVSKAELLSSLEAFLITQISQGKRCLLIVDEAQNLTPRAVEELRMLSNFQLGNQSLLQSFLVGQPEFRSILQRSEMEQFRQRVAATCHIGPLDLTEVEPYIHHRLKCAGAGDEGPQFERDVFSAIFRASEGIPRRINSICDRVLLLAFLAHRKQVTLADVSEVISEFAEEGQVPAALEASTQRTNSRTGAVDVLAREPSLQDNVRALSIDPRIAERMSTQLLDIDAQDHDARLQRLEQSLARLERTNAQTLMTLRELVNVLRSDKENRS